MSFSAKVKGEICRYTDISIEEALAFPPGTPPETTIAALREMLYHEEGAQ